MKKRNTGIELLKVVSIFLIVLSHVVQTMDINENNIISSIVLFDLKSGSTDINQLILSCIRMFGCIGNVVFVACSAFFLCENNEVKKTKINLMLFNNWIIHFIFLVVTVAIGFSISKITYLKAFFPTTFSMCWFLTTYVILYIIHPYLNMIINNSSKDQLKTLTIFLIALFGIIDLVKHDLIPYTELAGFITIYFTIAYLKKYKYEEVFNTTKNSCILAIIGAVCIFASVVILNLVSIKYNYFNGKILHFFYNCSIFNIILAVGLIGLFMKIAFKSRIILKISSLTLLIYILHENYFMQKVYRPWLLNNYLELFSAGNIVLRVLLFAVIFFILITIIAYVIDCLEKLITKKES